MTAVPAGPMVNAGSGPADPRPWINIDGSWQARLAGHRWLARAGSRLPTTTATTNQWTAVELTTTAPGEAQSMLIRLTVTKSVGSATPFEIHFDNVTMTRL